MPVKIVQKQATKPDLLIKEVTTPADPIAIAVDRMVELEVALAETKPLFKEQDKQKKVLAAAALSDNYAPDQKVILSGAKGTVEFSPKTSTTTVTDMQGLIGALKAKIGYEGLLGLINISLTDAKQYLSESELAPYVESGFGSRRLMAVTPKDEA
jgi:hypothetical protein